MHRIKIKLGILVLLLLNICERARQLKTTLMLLGIYFWHLLFVFKKNSIQKTVLGMNDCFGFNPDNA